MLFHVALLVLAHQIFLVELYHRNVFELLDIRHKILLVLVGTFCDGVCGESHDDEDADVHSNVVLVS